MSAVTIAPVSFDYDGAAAASGYSRDVIIRAARAGDIPVHYPEIDGRQISKPTILADDLKAWLKRGKGERKKP